MRERVFIALLQLLLIPTIAFSQTGSIKGTVTDKNTGETLIGATVMINGTTKGTITDFDGNYTLENVEPGTYSITFSYVAYTNIQHDEVEVKAGEASTVNVIMEEATTALEEVKVVGKANREAEAMLLMEQKSAVLATQAIGAKELSRKGVSDAEGAVTKISGISKQEGAKNVIVRGLGDRYNSSTLNGFPIPSEDPEYKNISLDYFTSDMIQAVGVNKVFGANQWGDVGGAHIDIKSKELIKSSELELSLSLGTNNQSFGKEFLKTEGVNSFGFANIHNGPIEKTNGGGREYIDEYSFPNSLDPIKKNTPLNSSITIAGGRKFGGDRHRFFLVGAYGTDSYIEEGVTRNTTTTESVPFRDFNYTRYEQFTSHLIMGNLDFDFNKSRIFYNALYIHTNNQYFSEYFGKEGEIFQNVEDLGSQGLLRRQQINDNSILVNQLVWKWDFLPRFSSDAGVSYNYVTGNEPDRRVNYLSNIGNNQFELRSGDARQQRFYNELVENDINVKASITYQLTDDVTNKSSLSVGYSGRFAQKDFIAPIYNKDWEVGSSPLPIYPADNILLDNDFNQENLDAGNFTVDLYEDKYDVEKFINGGYASLIYQFGTKFTANVGLRVDQVYIKINYDVNKGGSQGSDKIDSVYFLPSVNLKYDINNKNSIRFGSSVTYTLPQDKEISPFVYNGPVVATSGNPNLIPSINYNIDIKWDYYLSRNEILTINGFYKYITDPIARIDQGNSAGLLTYDNIAEYANAYGIELEFRKGIFELTGGSNAHKFNLGFNGSYIFTNIELKKDKINAADRSSELEGAAPVIINADLTYVLDGDKFDWTNALVINYFSDKVHTIGTNGYANIVEEGLPTLDFVTSANVGTHWKISFKAKNLLNPYYQLTREPNSEASATILDQYKKGVSMSLGLSYKF